MKTDKRKALLGMVLIGVALAVLPFLVGQGLGNSWVRVLDFALLYVMLALGLNIVVGFAGLMGVNINTIISATFLIGSALAAVAGVMVSANYSIAHYHMGFILGLKAFTAAVQQPC